MQRRRIVASLVLEELVDPFCAQVPVERGEEGTPGKPEAAADEHLVDGVVGRKVPEVLVAFLPAVGALRDDVHELVREHAPEFGVGERVDEAFAPEDVVAVSADGLNDAVRLNEREAHQCRRQIGLSHAELNARACDARLRRDGHAPSLV